MNHTQHICRFTNLPFISQLANICVSPCPVHLVSNVQRHECRNCTFGLEHQRWENIFVNTNEVSNKQNKRAKAHKRMGDEKTSSKFKSRKRLILVFEFAFRAVWFRESALLAKPGEWVRLSIEKRFQFYDFTSPLTKCLWTAITPFHVRLLLF